MTELGQPKEEKWIVPENNAKEILSDLFRNLEGATFGSQEEFEACLQEGVNSLLEDSNSAETPDEIKNKLREKFHTIDPDLTETAKNSIMLRMSDELVKKLSIKLKNK